MAQMIKVSLPLVGQLNIHKRKTSLKTIHIASQGVPNEVSYLRCFDFRYSILLFIGTQIQDTQPLLL